MVLPQFRFLYQIAVSARVTMPRQLLLAFALLSLLPLAAQAQSCEAFADAASICAAHLPPSAQVFVPAGLTQQNLAADLASALSLPPPCGFYSSRSICLEAFRVCAPDGQPTPLCPSVCTDYNGACRMHGIAWLDCAAADPDLAGAALYADTAARNASIACVTSPFFGEPWAGQPSACASVLTCTCAHLAGAEINARQGPYHTCRLRWGSR